MVLAALLTAIVAATPIVNAVAVLAIQQQNRAAKPAQHHLGDPAVIAVPVLPFAVFQRALDQDLRSLFDEALDDADQALVVDGNVVPLGALALLAAVLVLPAFGRRHREVAGPAAVLEAADLGVFAQASDEGYAVIPPSLQNPEATV